MVNMIILDDHPLVRQGIRTVISSENKINIVGEASNAKEALKLMATRPDLALVDLNLGEDNGLDFIQYARSLGYNCKYLILTSSATSGELRLAQSIGVEGICLKEALPEDLLYAVDVVARGRKYYDPVFMDSLMDVAPTTGELAFAELTPKELEVLISLGKGQSNKEIAGRALHNGIYGQKTRQPNLTKLSLADRTQAALYALSKGLVQFELC